MAIGNVEASNNDAVFVYVSDFDSARAPKCLSAIESPTPEKRLKFRWGFSEDMVNSS